MPRGVMQGWIACGGEGGLLKVLKLESATPNAKVGVSAALPDTT
jgi:hypothetical protein